MSLADPVDHAAIGKAVDALLHGGLVAFPTETVYGLGADADQPRAVSAIYRAKGRPQSHPVIVHLADPDAAEHWARVIPEPARQLAQHFWPGPLTLIVPRGPRVADAITGGQDTVGLRCPSHPWAQALLRGLGRARRDSSAGIAAPSANRYGRISPTRADHVHADLGQRPEGLVDVILDGGASELGIESTIVDFPDGAVRILRPGSVRAEEMRAVVGGPIGGAGDNDAAPRVSGRIAGHYAPHKPLELVDPGALAARVAQLGPLPLGVMAPPGVLAGLPPGNIAARIAAAPNAPAYAHDLYSHLRALDASPAHRLLIALPPSEANWEAVHDRLRRSAAGSEASNFDAD